MNEAYLGPRYIVSHQLTQLRFRSLSGADVVGRAAPMPECESGRLVRADEARIFYWVFTEGGRSGRRSRLGGC